MPERTALHKTRAQQIRPNEKGRIPERYIQRVLPFLTLIAMGHNDLRHSQTLHVHAAAMEQAQQPHCVDPQGRPLRSEIASKKKDYACIGTMKTPFEAEISILEHHGESQSDHYITIVEFDSNGNRLTRRNIQLNPPHYDLPSSLHFKDHAGNGLACTLKPDGTYGLCHTAHLMKAPPVKTIYPTRTPTRTPTKTLTPEPSATSWPTDRPVTQTPWPTRTTTPQPRPTPAQAPASNESITRNRFAKAIQELDSQAANRSQAPEGYCYDSHGDSVPFGVDRVGTDDCKDILVDYPNKGDVTYVFESEPYTYGYTEPIRIDVVMDSSGQIHYVIDPAVTPPQGLLARIQAFFQGLDMPQTYFGLPVHDVQAKPINPRNLPQQAELPRNVVTHDTLSHYNMVIPIAEKLNYDPRTHLAFINVETLGKRGKENQLSHAGAMGLVQIMPGTWVQIRNRINSSELLLQKAQELGINPNTADPWNLKDNVFFSAIYLTEYCGLPRGNIPTGTDLRKYVHATELAALRYHDGPGRNINYPSPNAKVYMAEMRRIIPAIIKSE